MNDLRSLPSVDTILQSTKGVRLVEEYGRSLVVEGLRKTLDEIRASYRQEGKEIPNPDLITSRTRKLLHHWTKSTLYPVINATGSSSTRIWAELP